MATKKQAHEAEILKTLTADGLLCLMLLNGVKSDVSTVYALRRAFDQPGFPNYKRIKAMCVVWCRLLKKRNTKSARATVLLLNKIMKTIHQRFSVTYKAI